MEQVNNTNRKRTNCKVCNKEMLSCDLARHMKTHKKPCRVCKEVFTSAQDRSEHEKRCRSQVKLSHITENVPLQFTPTRTALQGYFAEYCLEPDDSEDYETALTNSMDPLGKLIEELVRVYTAFKYYSMCR